MPTTFANTIDSNPIYATRAEQDQNGLNIDQTYAKKSELPTVNNGTLTIQKNGSTIDTFSANSSANKTVNVTVPTKTSDITNDSGFITSAEIPPQQQADWNETDVSDPSYIQNKPSIPAAQVNSDWNASSGVAEVLNKPNLAAVATSGSYSDLTGTPSFVAGQNIVITESGSIITISATTSAETVFIEYGSNTYTNKQIRDMLKAGKLVIVYKTYSYYTTYAKPTFMYDIASDTGTVCFSAVEHPFGNPDGHLVSLIEYFSNANGWSNNDYDVSQADWNASSGAARILNKPTIRNVPDVTSSDDSKVLKATYSGGVGSYSWQTESGGGGGSDIVRLLSSNITTHQDYDNIVSEFTTKEVYIKPNDVYLDYNAYFRVIKATSSVITAELPVIENLDNGDTRYTGIIRYNITKSSDDSLTKLPTYYFTLNINLQTLGIELYNSTKAYKQNEFVFLANPHTGSDVNSATWIYRAREDLPANVNPSLYPAAWQRLSLDDYYRHLKKISVTPDNGSIELFYIYEGKLIESTGDIQSIDSYEGIESVIIQWTVTSYISLPTVPNTWHASSSNPSSLTVGRTYQLTLKNNCYKIEEFI